MSQLKSDRSRMVFDLPPETQMAIRLNAMKSGSTNAEVITKAVASALEDDLKLAKSLMEGRTVEAAPPRKRKVS